jgi:hypothetical protein
VDSSSNLLPKIEVVVVQVDDRSDTEKMSEGRLYLEKFERCSDALKSLRAVSQNGQQSSAWLDLAARSAECAGDYAAAFDYYRKELVLHPGSQRLTEKAEMRILVQDKADEEKAKADREQAKAAREEARIEALNDRVSKLFDEVEDLLRDAGGSYYYGDSLVENTYSHEWTAGERGCKLRLTRSQSYSSGQTITYVADSNLADGSWGADYVGRQDTSGTARHLIRIIANSTATASRPRDWAYGDSLRESTLDINFPDRTKARSFLSNVTLMAAACHDLRQASR